MGSLPMPFVRSLLVMARSRARPINNRARLETVPLRAMLERFALVVSSTTPASH